MQYRELWLVWTSWRAWRSRCSLYLEVALSQHQAVRESTLLACLQVRSWSDKQLKHSDASGNGLLCLATKSIKGKKSANNTLALCNTWPPMAICANSEPVGVWVFQKSFTALRRHYCHQLYTSADKTRASAESLLGWDPNQVLSTVNGVL